MDKITLKNKDRFLRSFCKKVEESSLLARFGFGSGAFVGHRTGGGFVVYRRRQGIFSLFALTLWGTFSRDGGRDVLTLRFGRCIPLVFFWILWCALMLLAGVLLVGSAPLFSLWFLIPAVLCALPLFVFSKKEKTRLIAFVKEIEE